MSTYKELLQNKEWRRKREVILIRDSHLCKSCSNKEIKKKSSKAIFLRTLTDFQSIDLVAGQIKIGNQYKILIRDIIDGSEKSSYVKLYDEFINPSGKEQYEIYYTSGFEPKQDVLMLLRLFVL